MDKPRSDPKLVIKLLRELLRVRYRDARHEALRRESIAWCARGSARQQREKWGLDGDN
jgi:hypothetical protein